MLTQRVFLKSCLALPLLATPARANVIDWDAERQTIDGFGVSGAFHQAAVLQRFPAGTRMAVLDLLFSPQQGAGFSILRNSIGDGGNWGTPLDGPTPTIEPRPGEWIWRGDEDQIWLMREAASRGCARFFGTVWSPPAWMKTTGDTTNGGRLKPNCYRAFAEYLAAYVKGYHLHHGLEIFAVSPANEPEMATKYSSCLWKGEELRVLIRDHIAPVFSREGVTAKLVLGEHSTWSEEPYATALSDPLAAARVDIVATHAYAEPNQGFLPVAHRAGPLLVARSSKKPVWQTEVSAFDKNRTDIDDGLYWAKVVHTHLAECDVSAWFYWWAFNARDTRSGLVRLDPATQTFIVPKRLFAIGQYARFIRPGFCRVEVRGNFPLGVWLSAFKGQGGMARVIVAINENAHAIALRLDGLEHMSMYRTSSADDLAVCNAHASCDLAARSITTFVA